MPLTPGSRLGPYEVLGPLGAGGMGEVYRARDPRLGREVAIKALPDAFARDPERMARFEREAKLLASLSHANIAGIHGLEELDGQRFLILEFVDGETLAARLARGPLPLDEAIEVGRHIAMALEAAHESGIVHRDLKPGNVMLTASGVVKVLDFGLAKSAAATGMSSDVNLSASPTMTYAATVAGVILGTAAYMSPEQARGKSVDERTDIWSFGCVLFECLTGKPLFVGETVSDLVAQILRSDPDWSALPADTPASVRRLLERCLRKDARERLRDIGDARIELAEVDANGAASAAAPRRAPRWPAVAMGVALGAAVTTVAWFALHRSAPAPAAQEASVMLPEGQRIVANGANHYMALSPDGRSVAFVARTGGVPAIHVRRLDRREEVVIPGTPDARDMFFSPDGEWLAYFDYQGLFKVSVHGGAPVPLATCAVDRGGVWLEDGSIIYSPDATRPLFRIPRGGGAAVAFTQLDTTRHERTHRWPAALEGSPWILFTVGLQSSPGDYDGSDIDAVSIKTGERRTLVRGARKAVWAAPGHLVFYRKGSLYAVPIDPQNPRVTTEPVPVLEGVAGEASSGAAFMAIARDGTMAWIPSDAVDYKREVGWFDRAGRWTPTKLPPGEYRSVDVSPDGASALVVIGPGGGAGNIWLADLAGGGLRRLTYTSNFTSLAWFPDGSAFAMTFAESTGTNYLATRRINAAGGTRKVATIGPSGLVSAITSDGTGAIHSDWGFPDGRMYMMSLGAEPKSVLLPTDASQGAYELSGLLSPDDQWLAYISNRTGREEVFLRRRDGQSGQWQVSAHGGSGVRWGRAGRELFYVEDETVKSVKVTVNGNDLVLGPPMSLFEAPPSPTEPTFRDYSYDPGRDAFLFTRPPAGTGERREIALSIGWGAHIDDLIRRRGEKK